MSFFSKQEAGRDRAARVIEGDGRNDEQQALLLNALRRAAGAPVSYQELRDAGVEFPAGVVSELELEGVPLERCRVDGRGSPGVRLRDAGDPPTGDPTSGWTDVRIYRASGGGPFLLAALGWLPRRARSADLTRRRPAAPARIARPGPRLLALLLVAVIGVATAVVLIERSGGHRSPSAAHAPRAATGAPSSTSGSGSARTATRAGRAP